MIENILKNYSVTSGIAFLVGTFGWSIITNHVRDFSRYHFLILVPIIFPIIGIYLALRGTLKNSSYKRLFNLLILLLNFALALIIFVAFSFSYWQF
jgi:hypothetical protein